VDLATTRHLEKHNSDLGSRVDLAATRHLEGLSIQIYATSVAADVVHEAALDAAAHNFEGH
jgi:hypothetical protein